MKCTLALVAAIFLIGISASEAAQLQNGGNDNMKTTPKTLKKPGTQNVEDSGRSSAPAQDQSKNVAKGGYPIGGYSTGVFDDTRLEQLKNRAAAVNPMNLISAVMIENKDNLILAVRSLKVLRFRILGTSSLGVFIDDLIDLFENINSQTLDMMIHSFPYFFKTLKKVGNDLTSVAKFKKDKSAIFDARVFDEITSPEFSASPDDLAQAMFEEFGNEEESIDFSTPQYFVSNRMDKPHMSRAIAKSADSND